MERDDAGKDLSSLAIEQVLAEPEVHEDVSRKVVVEHRSGVRKRDNLPAGMVRIDKAAMRAIRTARRKWLNDAQG